MADNIPPFGRERRRFERAATRELAKEIWRNRNQPQQEKRKWDVGWFLAAFMALGLLLLAPKVGRGITFAVLVLMAACLIHPIWSVRFVQSAPTQIRKGLRFCFLLLVAAALLALFGVYVWPPIRRHTLSGKERVLFEDSLKSEKGGDALAIHIACPAGDEKTCVYAGQLISLFGEAGWQVQPYVDRVTLSKAMGGITAYRKAGNKDDMSKRWNSGGYVAINEPHLLAVQKAFQALHIEIDSGADPDLAENVMMIYVGLEKEDESEPTHLTRTTEWVTGKRTGPFPAQ